MNGRARWTALMQYLNGRPNCTKEEIIEMIERIKKGVI